MKPTEAKQAQFNAQTFRLPEHDWNGKLGEGHSSNGVISQIDSEGGTISLRCTQCGILLYAVLESFPSPDSFIG